jgi:predicted permease
VGGQRERSGRYEQLTVDGSKSKDEETLATGGTAFTESEDETTKTRRKSLEFGISEVELKNFLQDLRYAVRMLMKSPLFTGIAVLTLALGIGGNTAIFSVVNAILLRPLPYQNPDQLVILSEKTAQFNEMSVAYQNYEDWRAQNHSFREMAAFRGESFNLSGSGTAEHVRARQASAGLLTMLGVRPLLGRDFLAEEDRPGAAPVVILGYGLWQTKFGGDPQIVGKSILLTDQSYTVVGVLPEHFWFYNKPDVIVPIGNSTAFWRTNRELRSGTYVIARLRPGATVEGARADMAPIAARLAEAYPKANVAHTINVKPMMQDVVGDVRGSLYLMLGAVGLVLLIACVNVANLLLVRATSRQKEIAVRVAMGASRWRMTRQLLTESVCLAVAGGALGLLLAYWGTDALVKAVPGSLPRAEVVGLDLRVLAFTFGVSFLTGVLFGLAPAWRAAKTDVQGTLKDQARGTTSGHHRLQGALVIAELGLALVLLVCAGLTIRSVALLKSVNPGFQAKNALTFNVSVSSVRYATPAKVRSYYHEVLRRIEALPGVQAASVSNDLPMRDDNEIFFYVTDRPKPTQEQLPWAMFYLVSPGYQDAMGLQLIKGRFLTSQDNETGPAAIVIDDAMARGLFPTEDPIGKSVIVPFPGFDKPREIVGVVNHVKHAGLVQDASALIKYQFYMPFDQIPDAFYRELSRGSLSLIVRTAPDAGTIGTSVMEAVRGLDKDQPVFGLEPMGRLIEESVASQRFATMLLGIFAGIALILGSVGIYGVMSYLVTERTQEMGIRMALGATRSDVMRLVLTYGLTLAIAGLALGLAASIALTRLLTNLLFGVSPTDAATLALVGLLLVGVAMLACYVPARRATRVDPMVALRYE